VQSFIFADILHASTHTYPRTSGDYPSIHVPLESIGVFSHTITFYPTYVWHFIHAVTPHTYMTSYYIFLEIYIAYSVHVLGPVRLASLRTLHIIYICVSGSGLSFHLLTPSCHRTLCETTLEPSNNTSVISLYRCILRVSSSFAPLHACLTHISYPC
jgi:hypothetical protein